MATVVLVLDTVKTLRVGWDSQTLAECLCKPKRLYCAMRLGQLQAFECLRCKLACKELMSCRLNSFNGRGC